MACCTYLSDETINDLRKMTYLDKELTEQLTELRQRTGRDWLIKRRSFVTGFFKKKTTYLYELLVDVMPPEYQIIGFYADKGMYGGNWTPLVSKELLMAFITGYLSGLDK